MNGLFEINAFLERNFPNFAAQSKQGKFTFDFYKTTQAIPEFLLYFLLALIFLIGLILVAAYQYNRWLKFKKFEAEMKSLDLENDQEGALAAMVKRYSTNEPITILYSAQLFDEMASVEIKRILGSSASAKQKEDLIDKVYTIRTKTYQPNWALSDSPSPKEEGHPKSTA